MNETFGIIKPNAISQGHKHEIAETIELSGLLITEARFIFLKIEDAKTFYQEHEGKPFFDDLIMFMTSGPVLAMRIKGDNAVQRYREIIGNTDPALAAEGTIRKMFGESKSRNSVHGSDSDESAAREIDLLFGENRFKTS